MSYPSAMIWAFYVLVIALSLTVVAIYALALANPCGFYNFADDFQITHEKLVTASLYVLLTALGFAFYFIVLLMVYQIMLAL